MTSGLACGTRHEGDLLVAAHADVRQIKSQSFHNDTDYLQSLASLLMEGMWMPGWGYSRHTQIHAHVQGYARFHAAFGKAQLGLNTFLNIQLYRP